MNLEEYIRRNREQLDLEEPNKGAIWYNISKSINTKKRLRYLSIKIAASIIFILGFSILIYQLSYIRNNQELILSKVGGKIEKQEAEYQQQINNCYKVLQSINYNDRDLATNLDDIKYIDDLISKYSEDLKKYGSNEQLIKSLMDLYKKKIVMLNRMLNEIEKDKESQNKQIEI